MIMIVGVELGFEPFHQKVWVYPFLHKQSPLTCAALQEYDRRVNVYADLLEKRVADLSARNLSFDANKWFQWFSIDVMGDLTFSKPFHMLGTGVTHPITDMLHNSLDIVGLLSPVPWLIRIGLDLLPFHPIVKQWQGLVRSSRELMDERREVSAHLMSLII